MTARAACCAILTAGAALAHVVSMSSGELKIDGAKATFELQIPVYETQQLRDPEHALLDNINFSSAGMEAHILTRSCTVEGSILTCRATYLFNSEVDRLDVNCKLYTVLVANHVHMLRATRISGLDAGRSDQSFFDISFQTAEMRFRPPSFGEVFARDAGNGFWRGLSALASLLFVVCLLVAARDRRELILLAVMFVAGEIIAALAGPKQMSPRFLESATALTVAYLAIEVLLLPKAGQRWLVVALLGAFHGLYFGLFLEAGGVGSKTGFLLGVVGAEGFALAILSGAARVFARAFPGLHWPWTRLISAALFITGIGWFAVRMLS